MQSTEKYEEKKKRCISFCGAYLYRTEYGFRPSIPEKLTFIESYLNYDPGHLYNALRLSRPSKSLNVRHPNPKKVEMSNLKSKFQERERKKGRNKEKRSVRMRVIERKEKND